MCLAPNQAPYNPKREEMKLTETDHPYYFSESNYYSNDASESYDTVTDFLEEYGDADIDMNLCVRFDIYKYGSEDERKGLYVKLLLIGQRKGIYHPICIESYSPKNDSEKLSEYLKKHWDRVRENWIEFSGYELSQTQPSKFNEEKGE
jgi:hypothetical protein